MKQYIETLEQVIILLDDNKGITDTGDLITNDQIFIDNVWDILKYFKQTNSEDGHAIHWRDGTFLKQQ